MDDHLQPDSMRMNDWRRWLVFIGYAGVAFFLTRQHETWGDELEAWNVMKSDTPYLHLLFRQAYYLHPTTWNTILYIAAQFTHSLAVLSVAAYVTALATAFMVVFLSPFRPLTALAILSGYYFIFEYAVFARGYGLATLFVMLACFSVNGSRPRMWLYYTSLILLSNTHLFGLFLAVALYVHRLSSIWLLKETRKGAIFTGILVFAPAACIDLLAFIQGSSADLRMTLGNRIWNALQTGVRAFVPMPAWWKHHFWNTQFLLEAGITMPVVKFFSLAISAGIVLLILMIFSRSSGSRSLIVAFFALTLTFALTFPMLSARYVGFLYISFVAALWLSGGQFQGWRRIAVRLLIAVQIPGGMFAATKEFMLPFSQIRSTSRLAAAVPQNKPLIADFGAMNMLSGVTDRGHFCLAANRVISCIPLAPRALYLVHCPDRYTNGTLYYLDSTRTNEVYLMSTRSPRKIPNEDRFFFDSLSVVPVDSATGAIEKFSDLYLYRVSRKRQDSDPNGSR
jgi:hypothetical protein